MNDISHTPNTDQVVKTLLLVAMKVLGREAQWAELHSHEGVGVPRKHLGGGSGLPW